jgi:hypothetical protein
LVLGAITYVNNGLFFILRQCLRMMAQLGMVLSLIFQWPIRLTPTPQGSAINAHGPTRFVIAGTRGNGLLNPCDGHLFHLKGN